MQTRTFTQTTTHARHIASKVAADLKRLQRIYQVDRPTDFEISKYQQEIALLLNAGFLGSVTYGFQRNGQWEIALKYTVIGGTLIDSDDPGGLSHELDVSNADFGSFLSYSSAWFDLHSSQQEEFKKSLPFQRTEGTDPGTGMHWTGSRNYISGELGVTRSMVRRI